MVINAAFMYCVHWYSSCISCIEIANYSYNRYTYPNKKYSLCIHEWYGRYGFD